MRVKAKTKKNCLICNKFDTGIDFKGHTECYAIKNKENIINTIQSTLKGML